MGIIKSFINAFKQKEERKWDYIYVFVDVHRTIIKPDYKKKGKIEYYPYAKKCLQYLSNRNDIKLGLYTCSYPEETNRYLELFKADRINFLFCNKNDDVENNRHGYFRDKPYFNVLIEDKAGFDPEEDWKTLTFYFNLYKL